MADNKGKAQLLGMPFGTANGRLRKMLLFEFAGLLDRLGCYRCKEGITSIDDFSIEHKRAWGMAADPVKEFFDIANIAFSHIKCNVGAAQKPGKKYGSLKEYKKVGFERYYARSSEQVLSRKRERYQRRKP